MESYSSSNDGIRRPVPTLTRENWRTWFKELRYWMIGENLFFAIEKDIVEYSSMATSTSKVNPSQKSQEGTIGYAAMKSELNNIITSDLDAIKKQKWESANAKILFMFSECIDQFDREHVEPFDTAKEQWNILFQKYNKVSSVTKRNDLRQITSFRFGFIDDLPVQMTISSAWSHIVSARSRVNESNPNMAATFTKEVLFEYLTSGLPSSYNTVLQSLDSNPSQEVYEKLDILERNEKRFDLSSTSEMANFTSSSSSRTPGKPRSRQKGKDSRSKVLCHFCEQEHFKNKCELRRLMTAMVADFQLARARDEERSRPSIRSNRSGKEKALAADDEVEERSSESENSSNSSAEDDEEVDSCHFSKHQSENKKRAQ